MQFKYQNSSQFSISTQFSSIWPIDRILSVAKLRARVYLRVIAMKRYSAFPIAPALLEPYHQIDLCHIQDTRWGVLPLYRGAVVVSTAPADKAKIWLSW